MYGVRSTSVHNPKRYSVPEVPSMGSHTSHSTKQRPSRWCHVKHFVPKKTHRKLQFSLLAIPERRGSLPSFTKRIHLGQHDMGFLACFPQLLHPSYVGTNYALHCAQAFCTYGVVLAYRKLPSLLHKTGKNPEPPSSRDSPKDLLFPKIGAYPGGPIIVHITTGMFSHNHSRGFR